MPGQLLRRGPGLHRGGQLRGPGEENQPSIWHISRHLFRNLNFKESPPSSVLAVLRNRWLSDGFKESALSTACWGVLQAKRRLMVVPDGFKARSVISVTRGFRSKSARKKMKIRKVLNKNFKKFPQETFDMRRFCGKPQSLVTLSIIKKNLKILFTCSDSQDEWPFLFVIPRRTLIKK